MVNLNKSHEQEVGPRKHTTLLSWAAAVEGKRRPTVSKIGARALFCGEGAK